uniref:Uncharacterized protein n=1 Tax=Trichuris muris TaxID=70415 RepID=A0A5S6QCD2_TRIMR
MPARAQGRPRGDPLRPAPVVLVGFAKRSTIEADGADRTKINWSTNNNMQLSPFALAQCGFIDFRSFPKRNQPLQHTTTGTTTTLPRFGRKNGLGMDRRSRINSHPISNRGNAATARVSRLSVDGETLAKAGAEAIRTPPKLLRLGRLPDLPNECPAFTRIRTRSPNRDRLALVEDEPNCIRCINWSPSTS